MSIDRYTFEQKGGVPEKVIKKKLKLLILAINVILFWLLL